MSKILDSLEDAFREKIKLLIAKAKEHGITLVPTSGRRTIAEQNKLYAQGRTAKGSIVTNAKGGQSPHNFGMGCDVCPVDVNGNLWWNVSDDIWNVIHRIAEELGLTPGYDFKSMKGGDKPHVEDPRWKEVQAKWKRGEINIP